MTRTVALLVFSGVQSLDLSGPMDVFSEANRFLPPADRYELDVVGVERGLLSCSNGLAIQARRHYSEATDAYDLLLVAGGPELARHEWGDSAPRDRDRERDVPWPVTHGGEHAAHAQDRGVP